MLTTRPPPSDCSAHGLFLCHPFELMFICTLTFVHVSIKNLNQSISCKTEASELSDTIKKKNPVIADSL